MNVKSSCPRYVGSVGASINHPSIVILSKGDFLSDFLKKFLFRIENNQGIHLFYFVRTQFVLFFF